MSTLMNCPHCDGDLDVEIESPDYDVGLTGYTVFINTETTNTHNPVCIVLTMNAEEINKLEEKLTLEYEPDWGEP